MTAVLKHVKIVLGVPCVMISKKKKILENSLIVTRLLRAECYKLLPREILRQSPRKVLASVMTMHKLIE